MVQGVAADGALMEVFEWESVEKSRGAPAIAEIGAHWKAMSEVMDFVPLSRWPKPSTLRAFHAAIAFLPRSEGDREAVEGETQSSPAYLPPVSLCADTPPYGRKRMSRPHNLASL